MVQSSFSEGYSFSANQFPRLLKESEVPLASLKTPTTSLCPEPDESSPLPPIPFH
jgi:hypothetical protein